MHQRINCGENINAVKNFPTGKNMQTSAVNSSDRTDLSTESGSGPIQLARARYRAARRSVADSPPHCMNALQRTLQATGQKARKNQ